MFVLEPDDALSSISAGIDELAGEELRHVDGADLIRTWKERCRLDAEFTRRFAIFEKRYGFTADGALSGAAWLRAHCHMDAGAASDRVFTARKLLSLPETEAAFGAGEINYEHARVSARALDRGEAGTSGGQKPHLTILVKAEALAGAEAGELEWAGPVPGQTVRRLACDCAVSLLVVGADGKVVHGSEERRVLSPAQRRAVEPPDRPCRF